MKQSFVRDPLTWLSYALLAYLSYYISSLGPIVPFLRAELALDYTVSGLHLSAFSAGVSCVALLSDRLARRLARQTLLWGGGTLMAISTVSLVAGTSVWVTLPSIAGLGLGGGVLLIMIQAVLADHHGTQRTRALSEANVIASLSSTFAPLFIGGSQRIGLSWRGGLVLAVIAFVLMFGTMRRVAIPNSPGSVESVAGADRLPRLFWWYWLLIFLCVAIEWCVMFWAASFLAAVVGLSEPVAAAAVSVFLLAMLLGRIAGSFLTRQMAASRLLLVALGIIALGFPIFWLAPVAPLNLVGLFVTGLGVANLYPLSLSLAMSTAPQQANRSSARATLGSSLAILVLPLALGTVADQIGIFRALGVVILLVAGALGVLCMAQRRASAGGGATSPQPDVRPTAL